MKKMKNGMMLAGNLSVYLGASKKKDRGGILSDLKYLTGQDSPNFVQIFSRDNQLATHLARRIKATVDKRRILFSLLYAEDRKNFSLQIGGALKQDRSGSEGDSPKKGFHNGFQAGHIAIGTYSINGQVISEQGVQILKGMPDYDPKNSDYPNFSKLLTYGLALEGVTEFVPAYINQAMGKIESETIYCMKGLIPIYLPSNQVELERQLIVESERMVNFFINTKRTFLQPIEDRLNAIKHGNAKECLQNPDDKKTLWSEEGTPFLFEGKESVFLEAIRDQFHDSASDFYKELDSLVFKDISNNAADFAEKAEKAKQELSD